MSRELIDAMAAYARHAAEHPEVLAAEALQLRRSSSGIQEVDAHRAYLADVLQGIHRLIQEPLS